MNKENKSKIKNNETFERFNQKNDIFNRSLWDKTVKSKKTEKFYNDYVKPPESETRPEGYKHKDYAFRNATWFMSDTFSNIHKNNGRTEGFTDEFKVQKPGTKSKYIFKSNKDLTDEIKIIAKKLGADLVGITKSNPKWIYSHKYRRATNEIKPNKIDNSLNRVIVIANQMDKDLIDTAPSALSGSATGLGYSNDLSNILSLSQYIINLGYKAVPSQNDTALSIPLAIEAGLGEYARNGLLITKKFGPRVRISKIFTDLPLECDKPISFGVKNYCSICNKCANSCPPRAISFDKPSFKQINKSNIKGIKKWSVNAEKCFKFWASQSTDCSICIRVCPYNKDFDKLIHKIGIRLANTPFRYILLKLDNFFGNRKKPSEWWANK